MREIPATSVNLKTAMGITADFADSRGLKDLRRVLIQPMAHPLGECSILRKPLKSAQIREIRGFHFRF